MKTGLFLLLLNVTLRCGIFDSGLSVYVTGSFTWRWYGARADASRGCRRQPFVGCAGYARLSWPGAWAACWIYRCRR